MNSIESGEKILELKDSEGRSLSDPWVNPIPPPKEEGEGSKRRWWHIRPLHLRDRWECAVGAVLNFLSVPGFVRPCKYGSYKNQREAAEDGVPYISVEVTKYYTIITVNDWQIYFCRRTGKLDGTGRFAPGILDHPFVKSLIKESRSDKI